MYIGEVMEIPLARPFYTEEEVSEVARVLKSGWSAQGPEVQRFEEEFSQYIGCKYSIALNSATSALHLGLLAQGVGKGDEVIIPDFTFPATGNAVLYCGATPVIVDVDLDTYLMDMSAVESAISDKTKAILPVHVLGNTVDMDALGKLASEHNLEILEDAACAHGAKYNGKKTGSEFCGAFSFHGRKIMSTGEGGMLTTNDPEIKKHVSALRSHGMFADAWKRHNDFSLPSYDILGYNMRLSDVTAAIGRVQLRRMDAYIKKRREIASLYSKFINEAGIDAKTPVEAPHSFHVYQTYAIVLNKAGIRDRVIIELKKRGIGTTIGYYSMSKLPLFHGDCKNGEYLFENSLALPLYHAISNHEVEMVVTNLKKVLETIGKEDTIK